MSFMQRIWDAIRLGEQYYEPEYDDYGHEIVHDTMASHPDGLPQIGAVPPATRKILGMPGWDSGQEVLVVEPRSFDDIPPIVTALKDGKAVILNLSLMKPEAVQRCVDFVAGGVYAIDGHQDRLSDTVFLFTPSVVQINTYRPEEPSAIRATTGATIAPHSSVIPTPTQPPRPTLASPTVPVWSEDDIRMVQ